MNTTTPISDLTKTPEFIEALAAAVAIEVAKQNAALNAKHVAAVRQNLWLKLGMVGTLAISTVVIGSAFHKVQNLSKTLDTTNFNLKQAKAENNELEKAVTAANATTQEVLKNVGFIKKRNEIDEKIIKENNQRTALGLTDRSAAIGLAQLGRLQGLNVIKQRGLRVQYGFIIKKSPDTFQFTVAAQPLSQEKSKPTTKVSIILQAKNFTKAFFKPFNKPHNITANYVALQPDGKPAMTPVVIPITVKQTNTSFEKITALFTAHNAPTGVNFAVKPMPVLVPKQVSPLIAARQGTQPIAAVSVVNLPITKRRAAVKSANTAPHIVLASRGITPVTPATTPLPPSPLTTQHNTAQLKTWIATPTVKPNGFERTFPIAARALMPVPRQSDKTVTIAQPTILAAPARPVAAISASATAGKPTTGNFMIIKPATNASDNMPQNWRFELPPGLRDIVAPVGQPLNKPTDVFFPFP